MFLSTVYLGHKVKVDDFEFAWFDNHLSIIYNNFYHHYFKIR